MKISRSVALALSLLDTEDARKHIIAAHHVVHAAQRDLGLVERAAQPLLAARSVLVEPVLVLLVRTSTGKLRGGDAGVARCWRGRRRRRRKVAAKEGGGREGIHTS